MSTALNDVASSAFLATGLAPAAQSSSPTGSTIDMITADGPCFAVQQVGSFTGDSLDGHIEESPNGSSWAAIDDAEFTQVTAGSNLQVIQFVRTARYVRYVGTIEGNTPSIAMAVLIGEQRKTL